MTKVIECGEAVADGGDAMRPCDKPAVAYAHDLENGGVYPVCVFHTRKGTAVTLREREEEAEAGRIYHVPHGGGKASAVVTDDSEAVIVVHDISDASKIFDYGSRALHGVVKWVAGNFEEA